MIVKGYKHGGLVTEYAGYEAVIRCYRSQYGETSWQWWAV